jgi:hypothetical protein
MADMQGESLLTSASPRRARPSVRDYSILSLAALLLMLPLLVEAGFDFWALLPVLFGAVGILINRAIAPLVLFILSVMLLVQRNMVGFHWFHQRSVALPILLPLLTFAYVAGASRLLALVRHTVPPDVRRSRKPAGKRIRGRWLLPREATTRSLASVPAGEIGRLLAIAPAFLAVAYLISAPLAADSPPDWYDLSPTLWRGVVLIWGGVIVLAALWAFLAYIGRTQASEEESLLFLQDQLWAQTRGEQRQINRSVARVRLRRQRKEERG